MPSLSSSLCMVLGPGALPLLKNLTNLMSGPGALPLSKNLTNLMSVLPQACAHCPRQTCNHLGLQEDKKVLDTNLHKYYFVHENETTIYMEKRQTNNNQQIKSNQIKFGSKSNQIKLV